MMEDSNINTPDKVVDKIEKTIYVEHAECKRTVKGKKTTLSKKAEKTYKVTVTFIPITEEEAKIKRAIIESIIKKGYTKEPP